MTAGKEHAMTEVDVDEMGPVDYLVVEFPARTANFTDRWRLKSAG